MRQIAEATIAFAQGDKPGILAALEGHTGDDSLAIVLLLRAGDVEGARRLFSRPVYSHLQESLAVHAEIEAALGRGWDHRAALHAMITSMNPSGSKRYLHAETLAHAFEARGDTPAAIAVLENARLAQESAFSFGAHVGYMWLRTQFQLADVYRRAGRVSDARAIEADLLAALTHAEADHPMLVALKKRN
jgi:hypothetical protein